MMEWWNPFSSLASTAAQVVTDGWIAVCLSVWNAGLWVLRLVLWVMDQLLTPDLSSDGPGHVLYGWMFWIAGALAIAIGAVQIGTAALRRDGKSLARAALGLAQFVLVCATWIGYSVALVAAAGGITHGVMDSMIGVSTWNEWQPFAAFDIKQITEGWTATVLMLMGFFMWFAAVAHFLVIVARDAALMVIVATGPIAAAGLLHESLRSWFWKAARWLHVAAFSPLLVVIVTGVGVQFASGVAAGQSKGILEVIGTAFTSVIVICVAVVSPLALFKLLAFVDPGTSSGAAMRAGMSAAGGIQGLFGDGSSGDGAASQAGADGTSSGEASAEAATSSRVSSAVQGGASSWGGLAGAAFAGGLGAMTKIGTGAGSTIVDVTNQEGVGHNTYQPDYQGGSSGSQSARANQQHNDSQGEGSGGAGNSTPTSMPESGAPGGAPASGGSASAGSGGGAGAGSGAAGGGAAAGGAEAAAIVLI